MKTHQVWEILPRATSEQLETIGHYPALIGQLLFNRGIRTRSEAAAFLEPSPPRDNDPLLLPGTDTAVARLTKAITNGERIAIYGDFDADGLTSTALLTEGLVGLGATVIPYIPDRVSEGHGLNLQALQHLHHSGATLIVTADCGISDVAEIAAAADLGIDTIITDHHSPPTPTPDAVAIVNPKLPGSPKHFSDLASVGVASKLIDALYVSQGKPTDSSLLEYVALGTVADLAPMSATNRYLVQQGLKSLNATQRPGLQALLKISAVRAGQADTEVVAYTLGPRINAPGRVEHADASYKLLVARSAEEANPLAKELDTRNKERQQITRDILEAVTQQVNPEAPILIADDPGFAPGVIGLAAGKLRETFNRPAIVCQIGEEETRGSCRSIPEFNMIEALRTMDELFLRYGGHAQAAGFSIRTTNYDKLKARISAVAEQKLDLTTLKRSIAIDAEIRMEGLTGQVIRQLRQFAPNGPGNPTPTLLARHVEVTHSRRMGDRGQHRRLQLKAGGVSWNAVAFDVELEDESPGSHIDMVFTFGVDRFKGGILQIRLLDLSPSVRQTSLNFDGTA